MKTEELLEQRAERGISRGASSVWTEAQATQRSLAESRRGPTDDHSGALLWFRLAIVMSVVAVIVGGVTLIGNRAAPLTTAGEGEDEQSTELSSDDGGESVAAEFDRLLVDGMKLDVVQRPFDPEQAEDGDDFLDRLFGPGEEVELPTPRRVPLGSQIFGSPDDPFNNVIIGMGNLEDGAFRPFGANLGSETLETYSNLLTRQNDSWVIEPESGLVELDSIDSHPFDGNMFAWEFDFRDGAERATLLVEPSRGRGVWVWVTRTLHSHETGLTVTETNVLGHPGVVVSGFAEGPDVDHVYWADDDYVYRLTASRVDGNNVDDGLSSTIVPRLLVVDDSTWQAALSDAESNSGVPAGIAVALLFTLLAGGALGYRRLAG